MTNSTQAPNQLINETSPYLLQHAYNPVDWYPWCDKAFEKARLEDKPVFLSIGYSTCHWCHVMAHESFEDPEAAALLNRDFICIKVDKEERPDIDSIYMNVCMTLTGSGGWPMTIFMDHTGKPFFAGTYFPKRRRYRIPGLMELLETIAEKWNAERAVLLDSAERIMSHLSSQQTTRTGKTSTEQLVHQGIAYFKSSFDAEYGGFGRAPKFPSPHNLLFLLDSYQHFHDEHCLDMAEKTLLQMAKGGIFDHIGYGFSRYSTDEKWLAPHFEKMLYDNALLIMAYTKAYTVTQNPVYRTVAEQTISYIRREMTHPEGGFYSAQDADSDGVEGKYYVFTPEEIVSVLGERVGRDFCKIYDITKAGNFEGKNIPNQIGRTELDFSMSLVLPKLYEYRKARTSLHKDDKILTAWNGLMIAALADAFTGLGNETVLEMAERAVRFIDRNLSENGRVFASFREGRRSESGFIDDYAFYIYALLKVTRATANPFYLERAKSLTETAVSEFFDRENGGFYLAGNDDQPLIMRPKETYDGAMPSGNSVMTMNLVMLNYLTGGFGEILERQLAFMTSEASDVPAGHSFFLLSTLNRDDPERKVVAVLSGPSERTQTEHLLRGKTWTIILDRETDEYKLKDGKTTYYVCENGTCRPPQNEVTL